MIVYYWLSASGLKLNFYCREHDYAGQNADSGYERSNIYLISECKMALIVISLFIKYGVFKLSTEI